MSSSGINSINSGPLIIRTYLDDTVNNTYLLGNYDKPIPSNYVLTTSTNGQLVPSDNIYISSITTSSFNSDFGKISTIYLSTVFSIQSTITFKNQVNIDNNPNGGISLFVNGSTVISEPGAQTTATNAGVTIWGLPNGNPISQQFYNSITYQINEPVSKIDFQLIGSGGAST